MVTATIGRLRTEIAALKARQQQAYAMGWNTMGAEYAVRIRRREELLRAIS